MHHKADEWIDVAGTFIQKVEVGTKIKFLKEKHSYVVRASNRFYSVCTKPLNMIKRIGGGKYKHEKTVLYTIIDWKHKIRGTENLVFGFGSEKDKQCEEMLDRITNAESDISQRNWCELDVEKIIFKK